MYDVRQSFQKPDWLQGSSAPFSVQDSGITNESIIDQTFSLKSSLTIRQAHGREPCRTAPLFQRGEFLPLLMGGQEGLNPRCLCLYRCVRGTHPTDGFVKSQKSRHSCESGSPDVVPCIKYGAGSAQAGDYTILLDSCFHRKPWIPVFTGMTEKRRERLLRNHHYLIKRSTNSSARFIFSRS